MSPSRLPGAKWLAWLRIPALRVGVLTGVYLIVVMVAAVMAANRVPALEPYARLRNGICWAAFALVMLMPVVYFFRTPMQLAAAGFSAWLLFTLAYGAMGMVFANLHNRMGVEMLHAWILGMVLYSVAAVGAWVVAMFVEMRHQPRQPPSERE